MAGVKCRPRLGLRRAVICSHAQKEEALLHSDREELSGVENVAMATWGSGTQGFLLGHTGVVPSPDNILSAQGRIRSGNTCHPVVHTDHHLADNL